MINVPTAPWQPALARPSHPAQGGPVKVLMLQGGSWSEDLLKDLHASTEYALSLATDGKHALEVLRESDIDVLLLDCDIPGLDADDLCRRIRTEPERAILPILVMSARTDLDEMKSSFAAGASDFIRRPFDRKELLARLTAAVSSKRVAAQLGNVYPVLSLLARMVEARTPGHQAHCDRLAHYSTVFGMHLGLSSLELHTLRRGAILHDIGKISIPEKTLLKPGPLNSDEWELIKTHPVVGANLLEGLHSMSRVTPIVRSHHELWDGTGYPDGLQGSSIPFMARVFQLVDVYDALSQSLPYKPAFSMNQVLRTLDEDALQRKRDPDLSAQFIDLLSRFPHRMRIPSKFLDHGIGAAPAPRGSSRRQEAQ